MDPSDRDRERAETPPQGAPTTMKRLIKIHGDRIYRLAIGITGNRRDAEGVVQDALWAVLCKGGPGHADRALDAWIYRIVVKRAYRKLHRRRRPPAEIPLEAVLPPFQEDGRHAAEIRDWSASVVSSGPGLRGVVTATMDELPAHYRSVLLLRDVEGLSDAETAQALRIAVAKVKLRVHRARLFLQQRLASHFSAPRVDAALSPLPIPSAS